MIFHLFADVTGGVPAPLQYSGAVALLLAVLGWAAKFVHDIIADMKTANSALLEQLASKDKAAEAKDERVLKALTEAAVTVGIAAEGIKRQADIVDRQMAQLAILERWEHDHDRNNPAGRP